MIPKHWQTSRFPSLQDVKRLGPAFQYIYFNMALFIDRSPVTGDHHFPHSIRMSRQTHLIRSATCCACAASGYYSYEPFLLRCGPSRSRFGWAVGGLCQCCTTMMVRISSCCWMVPRACLVLSKLHGIGMAAAIAAMHCWAMPRDISKRQHQLKLT